MVKKKLNYSLAAKIDIRSVKNNSLAARIHIRSYKLIYPKSVFPCGFGFVMSTFIAAAAVVAVPLQ
jgi:Na+/H+ antiporter NhaA